MKSILTLPTILIMLCLLSTCKKDCPAPSTEPNGNIAGHPLDSLGLPFATTEGLNTMGCLINGEAWLPLKENFLGDLVYHIPFSISGEGQLNISGQRQYESYLDAISIGSFPILDEGLYGFGSPSGIFFDSATNCGGFNLDSTFANIILIDRLDISNEIISGLFEMRVINPDCDTLTMTHGRFDLSSD